MSVYVDGAVNRFGRMVMCHMLADTTEELLAMADRIGVARRWIQHAGTPREHFDICKAKRELAVRFGAVTVVDSRELVKIVRLRRATQRGGTGYPGAGVE